MANFFSASYWKARFFKALPTAQADANPGSMSATLTGSGGITASLTAVGGAEQKRPGGGIWPNRSLEARRKRRIEELEELEEMIAAALVGLASEKPNPPTKTVIKKIERQAERLDLAQEIDRRASAKAIEIALVGLRAEINQLFATARQSAETLEAARIAQQEQDDEEEIILLLMAA